MPRYDHYLPQLKVAKKFCRFDPRSGCRSLDNVSEHEQCDVMLLQTGECDSNLGSCDSEPWPHPNESDLFLFCRKSHSEPVSICTGACPPDTIFERGKCVSSVKYAMVTV